MSEAEPRKKSCIGRWAPWIAVIPLLYLLSFGPIEMLLDHNSKWRPMSFETQHRVYAPVWWLMLRSEWFFKAITTYCRGCEIVMDQHPECPWSWHYLRIREGLEREPASLPTTAP